MAYTAPNALFSQWPLNNFMQAKHRALEEDIQSLTHDDIQDKSLDDLAAEINSRHKIAPIELGQAVMKQSEEEDVTAKDYDVSAKRRVFLLTLVIPFTGNPELLSSKPPVTQGEPPALHVGDRELTYPFLNRENLTAPQVDAHFRRVVAELGGWLAIPNQTASAFNDGMRTLVPRLMLERKKRLEDHGAFIEALSFPLQKVSPLAPLVFPLKRKEITVAENPKASRAEKQHCLEEAHYRDILSTLALMSTAMERSPHAFAKINEESLRFFFLVWLNANYRGGATGETFNFTGKTDILITVDAKTVFIGECKFWKGPASLKAAIDQVLSYASWRDTKTAILLFNRGHDFSTVLSKIVPIIQKHGAYVRDIEVDGRTEKSFILKSLKDSSQELTLTVLAFNLPIPD